MSDPDSGTPKAWTYVVVALLAVAATVTAGFFLGGSFGGVGTAVAADANSVAVFDVVLDRQGRAWLDILFDKPIGKEHVGEIVALAPGRFTPRLEGVWRWRASNILRFEPAAGFPIATEYKLTLLEERLLKPPQTFRGENELTVQTDQFLVEKIDTFEEPAIESGSGAAIRIRGEIHFNYAVSPEVLATRIRLDDPARSNGEPVEIELTTMETERVIAFRTAPVEKQKSERTLRLVIDKSLTPAEGNVTLSSEFVRKIPLGSRENLTVRSIDAAPGETESVLKIELSSAVDPQAAARLITIKPEARYRVGSELNRLLVTGTFVPGQSYSVSIAQGLTARDGSVLQQTYSADISVPDLEPSIAFQSEGMFLSAAGYRTVALESVNVNEVEIKVDRVYRNNLFFLFDRYQYDYEDSSYYGDTITHSLGDRIAEKTIEISAKRNKRVVTSLRLDDYITGKEPGVYRIGVTRPGEWQGTEKWLLITDVGIVAKQARNEFLVWTSSFRDLSAIAGAEVTLLSDQNQTIAKGTTDARGIWVASDLGTKLQQQTPHLVIVTRGDEFSFALLNQTKADVSSFDVGGDSLARQGFSAFLYGERDIYRPGELVEGLAVVRDRTLQIPPSMPLRLRHRDPQGTQRSEVRLTTGSRGTTPFTLALPDYTRTGNHSLQLLAGEDVIGEYRFQVEEFVPDRVKVSITPQKTSVGVGEDVAFKVESAYLFGPPAAGLDVEARVRLNPIDFRPRGFDKYAFGNSERKFESREAFNEAAKLDDAGAREFKFSIPSGLVVPTAIEALITSRVREQGGRGVSALARIPVHPYPYYIGVRNQVEGYGEPRKPMEFDWVAVDPGGKETALGATRLEIYRDRWTTVLRKSASGGYRYESTRDALQITSRDFPAGNSRGKFKFTPHDYGSYRLVVGDPVTGASTQVEFYVAGWGYSPWAVKNPGRLELLLDQTEYAPGETARVQVRAPFRGRVLLTIERDDVLYTSIVDMPENTATIDVPMTEGLRPNAYITATLVRRVEDLNAGEPGRAFGAVPVYVDRESNRLRVAITAPGEIRPRRKVTINVATAPGANVTIAAVDEGILQLIAQKTADPFTYFYRKLALGVSTFDIFSLLLPEVKVEGGAAAGGGEDLAGLAQFVRTEGIRRAEPVALWSGELQANGEGIATATFDVPEYQGALRVMAVAHEGTRFGSSEKMVRVRDPLTLLPTFPRFLSFNERVEIPVTVRNDTGRDGTFRVALKTTGPVVLQSNAPLLVSVPNGRDKTVRFVLQTRSETGAVRFVATGEGNGVTTQAGETIGVRADLPPQTSEQVGRLAERETSFALDAAQFIPGTVQRTIRISPLPLIQFSGRLEDLLRYPYGCTEQTISTAFPLIYFGDLAKQIDPKLFAKRDASSHIRGAIERLGAVQSFSGGFGMWPGSDSIDPWASVYAMHFLVEARRAGHHVDNFVHDRGIGYLAERARTREQGTASLQESVYALYVLARAGKADLGSMDYIRTSQAGRLTSESRAMLAAAYATVGNKAAIEQLVKAIGDVETVQRETGGNFNSPIRNRAMLLLSLLDAKPSDPRIPAVAERLSRDASTPFWSTQESSWALLALGQFFRKQASNASYSGTLYSGNKVIAQISAKTQTFDVPGSEPLRVVMKEGYKAGAAYFSIRSRGIPSDAAFRPSNAGIEITREYLTREGSPLPATGVMQGDLLVVRVRVKSVSGDLQNVVVQNLLPSGLEVENPRLKSTEALPWITEQASDPAHLDLRDDRVLFFTNLPANRILTFYTLVRAVTPGTFRLPPAQVEAMYNPALRGTTPRATIEVRAR